MEATIAIKEVKQLTQNEMYIVMNYATQTPAEIMETLNLNLGDYRGLAAKLSKLGLILTPNMKKKLAIQEAKEEKNTYLNEGGTLKQLARDLVCQAIETSKKVGKILSLPFETCKFERQLLETVSNKFTFVGVERLKETYFNMLKTVVENRLNMSCINGNFIDTVKSSLKNEYAHVYADFCGNFDDYHHDIKLLLKKKIVQVGGTVSITLSNRTFKKTSDIVDRMNDLNPIGLVDGNKIENAIKTFLVKESKNNYALTNVFSYKDDERQAMILFTLVRVK